MNMSFPTCVDLLTALEASHCARAEGLTAAHGAFSSKNKGLCTKLAK